MQKEKQSHQKTVPNKNPQLPHDRAQEIHPFRQKDLRPHQVSFRTGRQKGNRRSLRLDPFFSFICNHPQRRQEHQGPLLLLYSQNQKVMDVLQWRAPAAGGGGRGLREGCLYVLVWESEVIEGDGGRQKKGGLGQVALGYYGYEWNKYFWIYRS